MIEQHRLQHRVFLCGVTEDVSSVFRQTDIFAFPSEHEGFGLTLVEAMSMGLPVIACKDCIAVREIVDDGKTGMLADAESKGFSLALVTLIKNIDLRKKLGQNAYEAAQVYAGPIIWNKWECEIEAACKMKAVK